MKKFSLFRLRSVIVACATIGALATTSLHAQSVLDYNLNAFGPGNQYARDIAVDAVGNHYVGGSFESMTDFDFYGNSPSFTSAGMLDGYVGQWSEPLMDLQWLVQLKGSAGNDEISNIAVYPDGNNGVNTYITGYFTGASATIESVYLIGGGGGSSLSLSAPSGNASDVTSFICKVNSVGSPVWAAVAGSTTSAGADMGNEIAVNTNGTTLNVYATGSYRDNITFYHSSGGTGIALGGSSTNDHAYVLCYTDNGTSATCNWATSVASSGNDAGWGIDADATGHVYVTGVYTANSAVVGTTSGTPVSLTLSGVQDVFVVCYNNAGVIGWATRFGGSGNDGVQGIAVDRNGDVYIAGSFQSSITFGTTTLNSAGSWDIFVAKLNSNFTAFSIAWAVRGGSGGADRAYDIAIDNCGTRCFVAGDYRGTAVFGSYTLSPYNTGVANQDGCLLEFDANTGTAVYAYRTGGASDHDALTGIDVNAVGNVYACCRMASATGNLISTNAGAPGTYESYHFQWDHSGFPASGSGPATHTGIGTNQCNIYASGTMENTATFGSTTLSSVSGSKDAYMTRSDYYGNYNMFVRVTDGTAEEITTDQSGDKYGSQIITGYSDNGTATHFYNYTANASTSTSPKGFVCKVNGVSGNVLWALYVQGSTMARVNAVTTDANGNTFICGEFEGKLTFITSNNTLYDPLLPITVGRDFFFARISSSGGILWANSGGNPSSLTPCDWQTLQENANEPPCITDIAAYGIAVDQNSHLYITGTFTGICKLHNASTTTVASSFMNDLFVAHYTYTSGSSTLVNGFAYNSGGLETGYDITAQSSQEIYFTGIKGSPNASLVARCNMSTATPTITWMRNSTGGTAAGYEVEYMNGFVFMGGNAVAPVSFGGLIPTVPSSSGVIVKYNAATGTEICLQSAPIDVLDLCSFQGTNPGDYGDVLLASGGQQVPSGISQAYTAKINFQGCSAAFRVAGDGNQEEAAQSFATTSVFPNPFSTSATLQLDGVTDLDVHPASLTIYDLAGRAVLVENNITTMSTTISREGLSPGVYIYRVNQSDKEIGSGKIVVAE